MQNAKPRPVAKALVNPNQVHRNLAAGRRSPAAGICNFSFGPFAGTTLRPTALQHQIQVTAFRVCARDWILRYNTAIVFDIYMQVHTWNHAGSKLQNF